LLVAFALLAATIFMMTSWRDAIPVKLEMRLRALLFRIRVDHGVRITMPDGVTLAASLYLPPGPNLGLGTIYIRLPYDRLNYEQALRSPMSFAPRGYAVLVQDVRGKFASEGEYAPLEKATSDGAATLDWIVRQPWSNGKVGTFGCSALGELQYSLARAAHPAHAAMITLGAGGSWGTARPNLDHGNGFFEGGVMQLASAFGWSLEHGARTQSQPKAKDVDLGAALHTLPVRDMITRHQPGANFFTDYVVRTPDDPRWLDMDLVRAADRIDVPALNINTWGDQTIDGTFELAEKARSEHRGPQPLRQHVVVGPGNHCNMYDAISTGKFGDLAVPNAMRPYGDWFMRWFDQTLRGQGDGLDDLPPYQFYVIGEARWLASQDWPPRGSRIEHWYLGSDGKANSRAGNGTLTLEPTSAGKSDRFDADPAYPVPTRGGPICCTGNPADRSGPVDQADVEARDDVLVYTSEPLKRPLRIAGPLWAHLTLSSSAPDTDVVVRLVDVWPDGRATNVQEGALRMSYRDAPQPAPPLRPQTPVAVKVPMRTIAYYFPAGHRIRVHIAGSSFPRLERNLNTGANNYDQVAGVVANNELHHTRETPSFVELPMLADDAVIDADNWSAR
jgi:putative CocE/NonD family hydrolase